MIAFIEICTGSLNEWMDHDSINGISFGENSNLSLIFRYQHLALIDLDEFIIPRYNNTLSDLLK